MDEDPTTEYTSGFDNDTSPTDWGLVYENGIFGMVINLCQHKAAMVGMDMAKEEVALWLDKIASGLREA